MNSNELSACMQFSMLAALYYTILDFVFFLYLHPLPTHPCRFYIGCVCVCVCCAHGIHFNPTKSGLAAAA